jgi:hypothetical protein
MFTDDETVWATVVPVSDREYMSQRERGLKEFKTIDGTNETQSVNTDYSHLLSQTHSQAKFAKAKRSNNTQSWADFLAPKDTIDRFLGRSSYQPKPNKNTNQVFYRLHNQAIVKQKRQKELNKKVNNKQPQTQFHTLSHSKSTVFKEISLHSVDTPKATMRHKRTKTKNLVYDATAGHRLYLKSRVRSSRRERSVKKLKHQPEKQEKISLMSARSKYLADKKKYGNRVKEEKLTGRSKEEYLKQKKHLHEVICTFTPEISSNSKMMTIHHTKVRT